MALSKVRPGQSFKPSAAAHNALVDLDASSKASSHGDYEASEGSDEVDLIIVSWTVVDANQKWKYQVRRAYDSYSSTDWTGLESDPSEPTIEGRNFAEGFTKAAYVNSGITGLQPIPIGWLVRGKLVEINGAVFYRFKERNEPLC